MSGARSHEDIIAWQRANELKLPVYDLLKAGPITRDADLREQLRRSAAAAPRLIAEGFGRYLPGDFSRYLRAANGELKETCDALQDAVDRGYVAPADIEPLVRISKRASKAATSLIAYLRTAKAPHEDRRQRSRRSSESAPTAGVGALPEPTPSKGAPGTHRTDRTDRTHRTD